MLNCIVRRQLQMCTRDIRKMRLLQGYLLLDIIVPPVICLEQVSFCSTLKTPHLIQCMFTVRIWDTVGEEQTLKGEYKVLPGRMYVV